jgi:hypothetical protein
VNGWGDEAEALLQRPVCVLLTSVGNEAIHGFVDDLRRRAPRWRLVGTDMRARAAGLYRCDRGYTVPARSDPRYLDIVAALCDRHGVDVVLPLSTADQELFCRPEVQARLGDRPVVVSPPDAVAAANRKVALYQALASPRSTAALLPEHLVVSSPEEALAALADLVERHGAALLKSDAGTGGSGMICAGRPDRDPAPAEGRRWWPLAALEAVATGRIPPDWTAPELAAGLAPREGHGEVAIRRGQDLEDTVDLRGASGGRARRGPLERSRAGPGERSEAGGEPSPALPVRGGGTPPGANGDWPRLAVAYLPGDEYSVDVLCERGRVLGGVVRLRHAAVGGLALCAETRAEPDVLEAAARVAAALKLSYVNNIQFRRDGSGRPRLLEINPRIPGTIGLTVEAGLNLPAAAICLALGATPSLPEPELGVVVMRFRGGVFARGLVSPAGVSTMPEPSD